MFKIGDKVVPNGFMTYGNKHYNGTEPEMIEWEKESKVVTVESVYGDNRIYVTDGKREFIYHPSELRIATEKEIEALNETEEQEFEFDFDNYFYALELNDRTTFIAAHEDEVGNIWGLSCADEIDISFIDKGYIKKIIAIIPKR